MTDNSILARYIQPHDVTYIYDLSARVQAQLTQSGSLQEIGPIPITDIEQHVTNQTAFILEVSGRRTGSVFVEPLDRSRMAAWQLADNGASWWFLSKLMIEPEQQRRKFGPQLVQEVQLLFTKIGRRALVLDCWAGNNKLRQLYSTLGFGLHGVFDENDYQIAVMVWPLA